jgi:hypothetical protein
MRIKIMFNELNSAFPNHTHFYEVTGLQLGEAMDRAARLSGADSHVLNYQGKIIFAVQHSLDVTGIDWLTEVPGSPVAEEVVVDEPVTEEVVEEVVEEPVAPAKSK